MRSSPLLLLLITTQYCFFQSICAAEDVTDDSVDQHTPSQEELKILSKDGLKIEVNKSLEKWNDEIAKKTKIEKELKMKKGELTQAVQIRDEAVGIWEQANEELEEENKPIEKLKKEKKEKSVEALNMKSLLTEKESNAKFPPETPNKKEYAVKFVSSRSLDGANERIEKLDKQLLGLRNNQTYAIVEQNEKNSTLQSSLSELTRLGCVIPEELRMRSKRNDKCSRAINIAIADKKDLKIANRSLEVATTALDNASDELKSLKRAISMKEYLEALENKEEADAAFRKADQLLKNKTDGSLRNAQDEEKNTRTKMDEAKGAVSRIENEISRLEGDMKKSTAAVAKAKEIHDLYNLEYGKRPENSVPEKKEEYVARRWPLSETDTVLLGFSPVFLILAIVCVVLCYRDIRKRKNKKPTEKVIVRGDPRTRNHKAKLKKSQKSSESGDARVIGSSGLTTLDVSVFKYFEIVQFQSYFGDLPHDKDNEQVSSLPKSYTFVKERMKFFFYGLEDKPKPTEKQGVSEKDITRVFFQPDVFGTITRYQLLQLVSKAEYKKCSPLELAKVIREQWDQRLPLPELKLDPAVMRQEFLQYLHAMASKSYLDYFTKQFYEKDKQEKKKKRKSEEKKHIEDTKFPMDINHIIWICANAIQVLKNENSSHLIKFNGSVVIVGDIHGQFPDLLRMFGQRATEQKPGWLTNNYLFLGDYVDRGLYSMECILFLFLLKILYPKHIMLLRGNHEDPFVNEIFGFINECIYIYEKQMNRKDEKEVNCEKWGKALHEKVCEVFEYLPISALINGNIFCAHGGIGTQLLDKKSPNKTLDDHFSKLEMPLVIKNVRGNHKHDLPIETMWNDPDPDMQKFTANTGRHCGFKFGATEASEFKTMHGVALVFRGHQLRMNGFEFPFDNSFITTFSAPVYEEYHNFAATFDIDLDGKVGCQIATRNKPYETYKTSRVPFVNDKWLALKNFKTAFQKNDMSGSAALKDDDTVREMPKPKEEKRTICKSLPDDEEDPYDDFSDKTEKNAPNKVKEEDSKKISEYKTEETQKDEEMEEQATQEMQKDEEMDEQATQEIKKDETKEASGKMISKEKTAEVKKEDAKDAKKGEANEAEEKTAKNSQD